MAIRRSGRFAAGVTGAGLGVAAGAALGAYVLNPAGVGIDFGGGAAAERDAAVARAETQQLRADEANRIIEPIVSEVVKGSLSDVPVLVIATPDATGQQLQGVTGTLRAAGAPEAGVLHLTDKFLSASGADELKDIVATSLPTNVQLDSQRRDPGRQVGQALAPVLELGAEGAEKASAADRKLLLEALKGGGFIDYDKGTLRPAAGIVIVGEYGSVARDSGADRKFGSDLIADFAVALAEGFGGSDGAGGAGGRVVAATDIAGAAGSAAGTESSEAVSAEPDLIGSSLIGALEARGAEADALSRISAVSDAAGQIGLVRQLKG